MGIDIPTEASTECMVLKTRKAARAITRRYNRLLRPYGLQCTQVSLLYAVAANKYKSVSDMADQLAIERSTLTRNLKLLRLRGYIHSDQLGQGRPQSFELTEQGETLLKTLIPLWKTAQAELRKELGSKHWESVQASLALVGAVR
ncbi:MAG: winged helix-turn-helix transcriptional regulator [Hyphomicrobiales bacterium]|nr:winged helix-turn-helix transcriptional regulator [Hyphomicrobiales bacterium]MCP4999950.1 winged helix-turn-helix transcriptional regulator [Hyphomicrobiales bacterium]